MRSKEAEIQQIMQNFNVDRETALRKLNHMIEWAEGYKKFVEGVHVEEEMRKPKMNLWKN